MLSSPCAPRRHRALNAPHGEARLVAAPDRAHSGIFIFILFHSECREGWASRRLPRGCPGRAISSLVLNGPLCHCVSIRSINTYLLSPLCQMAIKVSNYSSYLRKARGNKADVQITNSKHEWQREFNIQNQTLGCQLSPSSQTCPVDASDSPHSVWSQVNSTEHM